MYKTADETANSSGTKQLIVHRNGKTIDYVDTEVQERSSYTYYVWLSVKGTRAAKVVDHHADVEDTTTSFTTKFHFDAERQTVRKRVAITDYLDHKEKVREKLAAIPKQPKKTNGESELDQIFEALDQSLSDIDLQYKAHERFDAYIDARRADGIDEETEEEMLAQFERTLHEHIKSRQEERSRV